MAPVKSIVVPSLALVYSLKHGQGLRGWGRSWLPTDSIQEDFQETFSSESMGNRPEMIKQWKEAPHFFPPPPPSPFGSKSNISAPKFCWWKLQKCLSHWEGGGYFARSNNFYLPSLRLEEGGGGVSTLWLIYLLRNLRIWELRNNHTKIADFCGWWASWYT